MAGRTVSYRWARVAAVGAVIGASVSVWAVAGTAQAAVRTWTGLGADANWSTAGNWSGGVGPSAGDDLVFPSGVTSKFNNNDFALDTSFGSITIQDGGYSMGGNSLSTDLIAVVAGPTSGPSQIGWSNGSTPPFTGFTVAPGGTTVDVGAGAELTMNLSTSLGANTLTYDIDGRLTTTHNYVFSPGAAVNRIGTGTLVITGGNGAASNVAWSVQSGNTFFNSNNDQAAVITQTGGVFGGNFGQTHGLTINGGTLAPGNETFETAFLQVESGTINIAAGGTFEVDINGVSEFDRLTTSNSNVVLAGNLVIDAAGFTPTAGMTFMIINNDGVDPVAGTFAGRPDGSIIDVNGVDFTIDYQGGDGNDVTLASGPAARWDGGGGNDNWTTAANWVGDVAPVAGDSLIFGNDIVNFPADTANVNDFPNGTTFADIVFNFAQYNLTGNAINVTGNVVGNNGGDVNTISLDVTLVGGGGISVPTAGAQLALAGELDAGGGTAAFTGGGFFNVTGDITNGQVSFGGGGGGGAMILGGASKSFAGPLTVDGKYVQVDTTLVNAEVVVHGQQLPFPAGFLSSGSSVNGIDADSGTVIVGLQNSAGTLTSTSDVTLDGTSVFEVDVDGTNPGTNLDQMQVTGSVTLGGTLKVTSTTPPLSGEAVIIANNLADVVIGEFSALPEGSIVMVAGVPMVISYAGGDGNDVSLSVTDASIWDGGGGNANWNTGANWVGDVVPTAGDSLIFPDVAAQKTNVNNLAIGTMFADVIFTGDSYNLSGSGIVLDGDLLANNAQGTNTVGLDMVLGGATTFHQNQGFSLSSTLIVSGDVAIGNANTLTLTGAGAHTFTGSVVDGTLTVDKPSGSLTTVPAMPLLDGPLTIDGGTVNLTGDTPANAVVNSDGVLRGEGAVGTVTTSTSGGLAPGFTTRGVLTANGNTSLGAGSFTSVIVDGTVPGTSHDQIVVNGTLTLAGFFSASSTGVPPVGSAIVVIDNDGSDAVVGAFTGLPEGATTLIAGTYPATISYIGGDGNDVTLFAAPTFRWDGDGPGANWQTAANWSGNVAPSGNASETLVFPNGASQLTANNDFPIAPFITGFHDIRFEGSGYTLTGNELELETGVVAANASGTNTYAVPTQFDANGVFSQVSGGTLDVPAAIDLNAGSLTLTGAGNFTGLDAVADGDLIVATSGSGRVTLATALPGLTGSVFVNSGTLALNGNLAAADLVVNAGTVLGTGSAQGMTFVGGTLSPGASPGITTSAGNFSLGVGATYFVELNGTTPGSGHDQLVVTGSVTLAGTLDGSAIGPAPGSQYVIISNDGSDAVVGTFAGLAEGATVTVSGTPMTVTYAGGDGNDVVLAVAQVPTTTTTTTTTTLAPGATTTTTTTLAPGATTTTPTTNPATGLPSTGGNPVVGLLVAVAVLVIGGGLLLTTRRRRV